MSRPVVPAKGRQACAAGLLAAAMMLVTGARAFAAAAAHYVGANARLTGHLSVEKRSFLDQELTVSVLHLDNPISLLRRSQYPGDAPATEAGEVLLRGDFAPSDFGACDVAATGILDFQRIGWSVFPDVAMDVQRIECRERGHAVGTVEPDAPSANARQDPYDCEPSGDSPLWLARRWSPYADMDPDMWKASDLLMRDAAGPRWPYDMQRALALRLFDARTRLRSAFGEVGSDWSFEYVPRTVAVEFAPELQSRIDALELVDDRIEKLPIPVSPGLEQLCHEVCGCTVVLDPDRNTAVSLGFSPTVNLLYVVRRLRELPDVRSARLVRIAQEMGPEAPPRAVLRVRTLPSAIHFTVESPAHEPGATTKRYFVVDDAGAREVPSAEAATMLSFDSLSLPPDAWQ
ncbi:MAG TPA: hypothetical protein VN634_02505 [Candidatus Limnocylindrales bacterium]|nr:hypothetical protein [Candidatus Limnocylindrales bacterium]